MAAPINEAPQNLVCGAFIILAAFVVNVNGVTLGAFTVAAGAADGAATFVLYGAAALGAGSSLGGLFLKSGVQAGSGHVSLDCLCYRVGARGYFVFTEP